MNSAQIISYLWMAFFATGSVWFVLKIIETIYGLLIAHRAYESVRENDRYHVIEQEDQHADLGAVSAN